MSWFDVLKLQRDIFGNPISEEKEKKVKSPSESYTDEEEELELPDIARQRGITPQTGEYKPEHINKPKKSRQTKLPMGSNRRKTSVPTSRESSGQTGDDTKLNIQSATRRLQRQGRGHYNKLADEITRLALEARVDSKQQKVILGKIRSRLADENIPRV